MSVFQASVQYDDFTGYVACDRSDDLFLKERFEKEGLVEPGEFLVAFRISSLGMIDSTVDVIAYLAENNIDETISKVRAVELTMPADEALSYFKRFDLVATQKGFDIGNVQVDGPNYD